MSSTRPSQRALATADFDIAAAGAIASIDFQGLELAVAVLQRGHGGPSTEADLRSDATKRLYELRETYIKQQVDPSASDWFESDDHGDGWRVIFSEGRILLEYAINVGIGIPPDLGGDEDQ